MCGVPEKKDSNTANEMQEINYLQRETAPKAKNDLAKAEQVSKCWTRKS